MSEDLDVLLPAIAAGDAGAFARWLAGSEPLVRAALRSFATRVDVEAVVQEALLRAWQVAPRVVADGRPNGLLRLAIRTARHLAIDDARRAGRFVDDAAVETAHDAPGPPPPDPMLRARLVACWERVPERPKAALGARLESAGDATDGDLAARCGMRLNTFLQNVARARKHLVACLEAQGISAFAYLAGGGA